MFTISYNLFVEVVNRIIKMNGISFKILFSNFICLILVYSIYDFLVFIAQGNIENNDLIVPDGIAVINWEGHIIAFNDAAQRITGYSEKDVILNNYNLLFEKTEDGIKYFLSALKQGESFSNLAIDINYH